MRKKSYITVTDQFCGAGGSSAGAVAAGAELKLALNHWKQAIATHNTNFPNVDHDCTDISAVDPRRYARTEILITSPECTSHTYAQGKKRHTVLQSDLFGGNVLDPAEERSRATMFDVPRFAEVHDYEMIIVENVIEARYWRMWPAWLHAMRLLDYDHDVVFFNSMFAHPTPQSRDRMYVVFWKKKRNRPNLKFTPRAYCVTCAAEGDAAQTWKKHRSGRYRAQYVYVCPTCRKEVTPYYYCAANAIDWDFPIGKIGEREKSLSPKTIARIKKGIEKFRRETALFIGNYLPGWARPLNEAIGSVTATDHHSLLMKSFIVDLAFSHSKQPPIINMQANNRMTDMKDAMPTVLTGNHKYFLGVPWITTLRNHQSVEGVAEPISPVTAGGFHHGLTIMPFVSSFYRNGASNAIDQALPTVTSRDRHALCVIDDAQEINVEDCYFRMLQPHELKLAMGFKESYVILGTKRDQVKQIGNAVTPPVMEMLMKRCLETF